MSLSPWPLLSRYFDVRSKHRRISGLRSEHGSQSGSVKHTVGLSVGAFVGLDVVGERVGLDVVGESVGERVGADIVGESVGE